MKNIKIAILDEELSFAEKTKIQLKEQGYRNLKIFSCSKKLQSNKTFDPDILLLDVECKRERDDVAISELNIPLLLMTEKKVDVEVSESLQVNAKGLFIKNSNCEQLSKVIEEILKDKQNRFYINFKGGLPEAWNLGYTSLVDISGYETKSTPVNKSNSILFVLRTNDASRSSVNLLVEKCYKLARTHISQNFNKIFNLASKWDLKNEDVAVDAISNLFIINEKRGALNIFVSFNRWSDNIDSESDAYYFLNKIVETTVNQHINKLLKEGDPLFSKILDSISHQIKKNEYVKIKHLGRTYVAKSNDNLNDIQYVEIEEVEHLYFNSILKQKELLNYIFDYFERLQECEVALPLNAVVTKITDFHKNTFEPPVQKNVNYIEELFIDEVIENTRVKIVSEIYSGYLDKNKINIYCANILEKTIINILNDIRDGKKIIGLYKYLNHVAPEIDQEVYNAKFQNILEYLYKKLKIHLLALLRKN